MPTYHLIKEIDPREPELPDGVVRGYARCGRPGQLGLVEVGSFKTPKRVTCRNCLRWAHRARVEDLESVPLRNQPCPVCRLRCEPWVKVGRTCADPALAVDSVRSEGTPGELADPVETEDNLDREV